MATKLFELYGEIFLKGDKETNKKLDKTDDKGKEVDKTFGKMGKSIAEFGMKAGAAIGVVGAAMFKLANNVSETAQEINKFSQQTGMTTKAFQEWDYVLKQNGYSMEQAAGDFSMLAEKAMDASNGVGEGAELFGMLGLKVQDTNGKLKSQGQLFDETISKLQGMEDITRRNAIASALLGTTGEELTAVLNMTNKELQNMKGNANVISEEDLKKAEEYRQTWIRVRTLFQKVTQTIGLKVMPIVQKVGEVLVENSDAIQTALEPVVMVMSVFGKVIEILANNINILMPALLAVGAFFLGKSIGGGLFTAIEKTGKAIKNLTTFFSGLNPAMVKTTLIVVGVVTALIALGAIIATLMGRSDDLQNTFKGIGETASSFGSNITGTIADQQRNGIPQYANGTDNHPGGLAIVGEEGPELINLRKNASVYTADETQSMLAGAGGNINIENITIDAKNVKEFNDIIDIVINLKRSYRQR